MQVIQEIIHSILLKHLTWSGKRIKNMRLKEVVVVLPYTKDKVLMQLRDFKSYIVYPGMWGFFGGAIEEGEVPKEAAMRELFEEIGYNAEALHTIGTERFPSIIIHSFFCHLAIPVEELILNEGTDLGLFSLEEIKTKELYSMKLKGKFPVVPSEFVENTIRKIWSNLEKRHV